MQQPKPRHISMLTKLTALSILGAHAGDVLAHHSSAPHYDLNKSIAVTGVVSKFELVNPHAYVYFVSNDVNGKQNQWRCELSAKAFLVRMGWRDDTFKVGEKITVNGSPARREENVCVLNSFVRADGTEIDARSNILTGQRGPVEIKVAAVAISNMPPTNLSGYWVSQSEGPGMGAMGAGPQGMLAGRPSMPEPSEAGLKAAKNYDQRFDDPAIKCSPANILFGWTHDQNVNEITQSGQTVTLKYGYMDLVRSIHLDQSTHPKDPARSVAGHSIGHWETSNGKSVLVVDTIGFLPGVLLPIGSILHSEQLHIVERFSLDAAGNSLTREYQAEDPLYLTSGYAGSDVMARSADSYTPYRCVELSGKNNQRS